MSRLIDLTDFLLVVISGQQIKSKDFQPIISTLNRLFDDNETVKYFFERVDIGVSDYDDDPRELWDIPEVKTYLKQLDKLFPYWFYFLSTSGVGLKMITNCCVDTIKVSATQVLAEPASMEKFINSHFISMNEICTKVGITEKENIERSDRVLNYLFN